GTRFEEECWCIYCNEINDSVKEEPEITSIQYVKGEFDAIFSGTWKNDLILPNLFYGNYANVFNRHYPIKSATIIALKGLQESKICSTCNEKGFIGNQWLKDGCTNIKKDIRFSRLLCTSENIRSKGILCNIRNQLALGFTWMAVAVQTYMKSFGTAMK
ncbi:3764_t:CDS:2, partial [Ambispora gerdemannii]